MEGVSSAYGYLVDSDGTMLYHPTADKIGKSVENEVVKGVVSQLQSGNIPQDAVVTYNFNGAPPFLTRWASASAKTFSSATAKRPISTC